MESEQTEVPDTQTTTDELLSKALEVELRKRQDLPNALIGGLAAAIVGAVFWAVITVATEYQIGYMAIAVGLLAGFSVRYFGCGIDFHFRIIGAFFALLGCALGNLLSQVGFIAAAESLGYFETITLLNFEIIQDIFAEAFSPMDLFFYAIAVYEGFKFSVFDVSTELSIALEQGRVVPQPFAKWKLHIVTGLFIVLATGFYFISKGTVGIKTFYYESGGKRAVGEIVRGNEVGYWETFWENGNIQAKGFYVDGKLDSVWEYFNEEGFLTQRASFKNGLQHGDHASFYVSGAVRASGTYKEGRIHGAWIHKYEDGQVMSQGNYALDKEVGHWESYYNNGSKSTSGSYKKGIPVGEWHYWFENGQKASELNFDEDGKSLTLNTWSEKGKPEIVNGAGLFKSLFEDGTIQQTGMFKDGKHTGTWIVNYASGSKQEEGYYKDDVYYIRNTWTPEGEPRVVNGNGRYETYQEDGAIRETGPVEDGLKKDKWVTHGLDHAILLEMNYVNGKLEGEYKVYFDNGGTNVEGVFQGDKRTGDWKWYTIDGKIESEVTYVNAKKEGVQKFYDETGAVIRTETYKGGELVASQVN
jgi:antitoxin component YwqK of YwqJK toxin-antitoxin module